MNSLKEFENYLNSIGIENNPSIYRWTVKTKLGDLHVSIDKKDFNTNGSPRIKSNPCFSIFARFNIVDDNVAKFINEFYSDTTCYVNGKINFHCSAHSKEGWNYLFERFKNVIGPILIN